jgi:thiol-disulfide isomerase/thioredoxin
MKKIYFLLSILSFISQGQNGYDIKFNLKGCKDTTVYLAKYYFDKTAITDSCKNVKNGIIQFNGTENLDRGVYILVNQSKERYIDFIVNENQRFTINGDISNLINTLKCVNSKENDQLFSYAKFMTGKDQEYRDAIAQTKGKSVQDSSKIVSEKQAALSTEMKKFDTDYMLRNKGTFIYDFMNMRTEKYPTTAPLASNGRPDSIYQYYYYRNHFFEGFNLKDERIIFTPFFGDKIKRYFDNVVIQQPDTVIQELDKIIGQCVPNSLIYNTLIGHFTYKYETNKAMSFDKYGNSNTFEKVFVHLADKYITNGNATGIYDDETVAKIKARVNILRNLLPGYKVSDLQMIDTINGKQVLKMGFDTARTSAGATYLYNKNLATLTPMFKTLYNVKAKYTILIFWASDCGHCQKEVPKLHEDLKTLKGKVDYKVFAVQTKEELFAGWKKFIVENKLTDFIHVFDPVHVNNIKETFDISGTPVIYLLDKDKKIKAKKLAADQVVEIIITLEASEKNLKK